MNAIIARCIFYSLVSLLLLITAGFIGKNVAIASLSACSASVDPSSAIVGETSQFSVQITNNDTNDGHMMWTKITRPSVDYTIIGYNNSGLPASQSESEVLIWGIDVGPSSGFGQDITVAVNNNSAFSGYWTVQGSDDIAGADPITCTGSLSASIIDPVNSIPPVISDITISDISDSSVKISWTTDKVSTSVIDYGTTSDYGQNKSDSTLVTSHSVTVSSLSANSSYHYRITSIDDHSNTTQTADNTFSSAVAGSGSTTTVTSVVVVTRNAVVAKAVVDSTPPSVRIDSVFDKPFPEAPKIVGKAYDNKGVQGVEYSLDNGKNWSPVDTISKIGAATVSFDFTPLGLDDDNYKIKVRAKDTSGNIGISKAYTMVIDRLPPDAGQSFFSLGPQPLFPDSNGVVTALEGLDQKITLSLVGGPITVDIVAGKQMFSLVKNTDNGLWSGILNFEKPGTYPLEVNSLDGAGNKSNRKLHSVTVLPKGIVNYNGKSVKDAKITVYYFDNLTKSYVVWDGMSYGQNNPQNTDADGKYSLFMPSGTYYLEINSPTFRTFKTNIFTLTKSMPINNDFRLEKKVGLVIGPLSLSFLDFSVTNGLVEITSPVIYENASQKQDLVGKAISDVELKNTDNSIFPTTNLSGKITVLSFLSTWDPFTPVQMGILNKTKSQTDASIIAIFPQESSSKITIYKKRGNYDVAFLADPDGLLIKPLNIQTLPFHVFLNRKGIITKVSYGVLTGDEILGNLIN